MNTPSPQLIVRAPMPLRQRLLWAALALTLLIGAYGAFEYGRSNAGFDFWHAVAERRELSQRIDVLEEENRELRAQLAAGETERVSMVRERAEVARAIGDLQAQISRQTQELAFYQGVVAKSSGSEDLKIQRVVIEHGAVAGQYRLKIAIVRRVQNEKLVNGTVLVHVDGQRQGQAVRLSLAQLTQGRATELPYSFRYVENLETDLILPVDFQAERVTLEVRSARKDMDPLLQTVVWDPEAA